MPIYIVLKIYANIYVHRFLIDDDDDAVTPTPVVTHIGAYHRPSDGHFVQV